MEKGVTIGIVAGVVVIAIIAIVLIFALSGNEGSESRSFFGEDVIEIKNLPNSEVVEKINEANSGINKFDVEIIQKQEMVFSLAGNKTEAMTELKYTGTIDNVNKEMHLEGTSIAITNNQTQEGVFSITIRGGMVTVEEDKATANIGGQIITKPLEDGVWKQHNSLDYSISELDSSFKYAEDEGDYYVLILDIDAAQAGTLDDGGELGEAYVKLWVDKSDLIVKKTRTYIETDDEELYMKIDVITTISNIS